MSVELLLSKGLQSGRGKGVTTNSYLGGAICNCIFVGRNVSSTAWLKLIED